MKNLRVLLSFLFAALLFGRVFPAESTETVSEKVRLRLKEKDVAPGAAEKVKTQLKLRIKTAGEIDEEEITDLVAVCLTEKYSPEEAVKISLKVREISRDGSPQEKRQARILVKELVAEGVGEENISNSLEVLKLAVSRGKSPSEARLKIALAVHNAKAEGLKGKELAERIHEVKAQLKTEKRETGREKTRTGEEAAEKMQQKNKERAEERTREADKEKVKETLRDGGEPVPVPDKDKPKDPDKGGKP